MRNIKSKIALATALVIGLFLYTQAASRPDLPPAVAPSDFIEQTGFMGLPKGRCFPHDFTADRRETIEILVSLQKSLVEKESGRDKTLIELARLSFKLGEAASGHEKRKLFENGTRYAEILIEEEPGKVDGYYWHALNLCGLCEMSSPATALSMIPDIVENLKVALGIDETYDQGGPLRVLGRILFKAPQWPLSEGDMRRSLSLLRSATRIAPDNSTNHLYLAETLLELDGVQEACIELDRALASKCNAISPLKLKEDQEQAVSLMSDCGPKRKENAPGSERSIARSMDAANDITN